ncbi:MAG: hypothetical protein [Bacteriophage sp.]|nr:MAG: hypothetical protein [Bacteriophage sp.]
MEVNALKTEINKLIEEINDKNFIEQIYVIIKNKKISTK